MNAEDKVSQEGVALEPTKEVAIRGEVTGIDISGIDEGKLERAKIAIARAERKKAKAQERVREKEKGAEEQGIGEIEKIRADHGPFPSRMAKGSQRECVMCGKVRDGEIVMTMGRVYGPQECYYCPERIYCSELCQARDWPEHKKNCKMGEVGTESRIREVQVLNGSQQDKNEELG